MGYENCGRREKYPYDLWLNGEEHVVRVPPGLTRDAFIRSLRYGARRHGKRLYAGPAGNTTASIGWVKLRALPLPELQEPDVRGDEDHEHHPGEEAQPPGKSVR